MRTLATALWLLLLVSAAGAQGCGPNNPNCIVPTAPPGTSDNRAASTAFVQGAVGGGTFANVPGLIAAAPKSPFSSVISVNGTTNCPLTYARGTTTPIGGYGEIQDSAGVFWEPQFSIAPVRACQFGTVPDGMFGFGQGVPVMPAALPTGTDNTPMLQAALDFAMGNNVGSHLYKTVCVDDGQYLITDTLAVGWGIFGNNASNGPRSLAFISCNNARASYNVFAGVTIYSNKTDRCAINVSGGRQTRINGIHLVGMNYAWGSVRYQNANLPVAGTAAGWLDPGLVPGGVVNPGPGGGLNQYSPYGGFCVDAYNGGLIGTFSIAGTTLTVTGAVGPNNPIGVGFEVHGAGITAGTIVTAYLGGPNYTVNNSQTVGPVSGWTKPPTPYPDQTFPAWTGNTTGIQYNQAGSTDTLIENTSIEGFGIGWNISSSPGQQNGDFNTIRDSICQSSTYCTSVGSGQSRNLSLQNVHCSNVYTYLTNQRFGVLSGELGGNLLNVACGQAYQLLDIIISTAGTTIQDYYTEAGVKIGNIAGGSITFRNCTLSFPDQTTGVVPAALIEMPAGGGSVKFDDCKIGGSNRITTLVHNLGAGSVTVSGGTLSGGAKVGTIMGPAGPAGQYAVNYTGGFFAGASVFPNATGLVQQLFWQGLTSATLMTSPTQASPGLTTLGWSQYPVLGGINRQGVTQAMAGFYDGSIDFKYWQFLRSTGSFIIDLTSGQFTTPLTLATCDTWTGQWSTGQESVQNGMMLPGDFFYHQPTGTIFVVESIGPPTPTNWPITLRQHNNMTVNASQVGGTSVCVANNLGSLGATPPTGSSTAIHVVNPQVVASATVSAPGTGYAGTSGVLTMANTLGCTNLPSFNVTVAAGAVTGVTSVANSGVCPAGANIVNPVATTGGGGTGATLNVTYSGGGLVSVAGTIIYCDFTQGSVSLINCDRGTAGDTNNMTTVLQNGDRFWGSAFNDPSNRWPFQTSSGQNNVLSSLVAGSATLTGPGASRTGRFPLIPFQVVDGGYTDRSARGSIGNFNGLVQNGVTFAQLPPAVTGTFAYMTNGLAANCGDTTCTTFGTTVTGGGGVLKLLVWYNGTNWTLFAK